MKIQFSQKFQMKMYIYI